MNDAWRIASDNFRIDDGSLPSIDFAGLTPASVRAIFEFFRENGECVTESPTLWDSDIEADVPLMPIVDPCALIQQGRTDSFHCCFGSIRIDSVELPVIGTFVFRNSVGLDYRMGSQWNSRNVDAFFKLIAHLKTLAPESTIKSTPSEGLVNERSFLQALNTYTDEGITK
ncbi:MAG: hypothetical protein AAFY57_10245 [Cyanobacteria bacterium J06642_2]